MLSRRQRRQARSWAVALAALVVGGGGAALLVGGDDGPPATQTGTSPATVAGPAPDHEEPRAVDPGGSDTAAVRLPPRGRLFGFSDSSFLFTGQIPDRDVGVTPDQQAADIVAAGGNAGRILIAWAGIEPEPGRYDEAYLRLVDTFVEAMRRRGAKVLLTLGAAPAWARAVQQGPTSAIVETPDAERRYAAMAGLVARRWPDAAGIETWNEPNTTIAWQGLGPQPERWARLHKAAAAAIRAASPDLTVLAPAMSGAPEDTDENLGPQSFLKRMYAAGLRPEDYDALSVHPYPVPVDGQRPTLDRGPFAAQLADFRLGYRDRDPDARVWITETGSTTTGEIAVTPADQARTVAGAVRKLFDLDEVDAVFVHTLYVPRGLGGPRSKETGFGLVRPDERGPGRATEAYCALRDLAASPPPTDACPAG